MSSYFTKRRKHDWVIPRKALCIMFWVGVVLLFIGIILVVTGQHKDPMIFRPWGSVLIGLGFCLLLICLILCIHAYWIIAEEARVIQGKSVEGTPLKEEPQKGFGEYPPSHAHAPWLHHKSSQENNNANAGVTGVQNEQHTQNQVPYNQYGTSGYGGMSGNTGSQGTGFNTNLDHLDTVPTQETKSRGNPNLTPLYISNQTQQNYQTVQRQEHHTEYSSSSMGRHDGHVTMATTGAADLAGSGTYPIRYPRESTPVRNGILKVPGSPAAVRHSTSGTKPGQVIIVDNPAKGNQEFEGHVTITSSTQSTTSGAQQRPVFDDTDFDNLFHRERRNSDSMQSPVIENTLQKSQVSPNFVGPDLGSSTPTVFLPPEITNISASKYSIYDNVNYVKTLPDEEEE
ncbi:unnamed protein product [Owenia fusiformis]|uniref:Uncharacterized protein n=1 Tax=Owenia fusiformis TaxID=6347 RepID=A0A8J1TM13_OWEFU|nr:unnamed protein product [Owenia fusiformis]